MYLSEFGGKGEVIVATPDGSFFSEGASELDNYKWKLTKITQEYAGHLCQKSQDYVVYRPLTLREKTHRGVHSGGSLNV